MRWILCAIALSGAVPASARTEVAGHYLIVFDSFGTPTNWVLTLEQQGEQLSGELAGDKLSGTLRGGRVTFLAKDDQGGSEQVTAKLVGGRLKGTMIVVDGRDATRTERRIVLDAAKLPKPSDGPPRRHEFTPSIFYRDFSPLHAPVLHINPGDTIHTTTVDAGGVDAKGVRRSLGGNPQTGPFYIDGALPGDTLVVHILRLKLNRDYAISSNGVVERGQDSRMAVRMNGTGDDSRWTLDRALGLARPDNPSAAMRDYVVPVKPMLGGMAVATRLGGAAPNTGDAGSYGGNMDFNELVEGTTLFLPVYNPGALLYFGDAHAAQGDGELSGNALETSMDVEVRVGLIRGKSVNAVRLANDTHIMAMGLGGSLDSAFKAATSNMAGWLASDYKLAPVDIAQLFGTAAEYRISEVADRDAGIVLKISKARLETLRRQ